MAAPGKGGLKLNHLTVNGVKEAKYGKYFDPAGSLPFFIGAD